MFQDWIKTCSLLSLFLTVGTANGQTVSEPTSPIAAYRLVPEVSEAKVGDVINIDIVVTMAWHKAINALAYTVLLQWDPETMRLLGSSSIHESSYFGFAEMAVLNATFDDGDAQYIAFASPGNNAQLALPPNEEPFILATIRFQCLKAGLAEIDIDLSENEETVILGTDIGAAFLGWFNENMGGHMGSVQGTTVLIRNGKGQVKADGPMAVLDLVTHSYQAHLELEGAQPDPVLQLALRMLQRAEPSGE